MKTKFFAKHLQNEMPLSAFCLTVLVAVLVIAEGVFWVVTQAFFAVSFDVLDLFFHFGPGVMLALCAVLLLRQPPHNKVLGISIGIFALLSAVAGGGFLVGFALGLIGGVLALTWKSQMRIIRPLENRLMKLTKKNRAAILLAVAVIAVLVVMPTELGYQLNVNAARQNLLSGSKLVNTQHGLIEYTDVRTGYPVLVSHGAGMGYAQVQSVEQMLGTENFRFIVPSRFGYLRTPLPSNASFASQADAFADLLDALNISKVVIMGISIGGPAALEFAVRHPDRCSALIMASAISYDTPPLDLMGNVIHHAVFRSDIGFWLLSTNYQAQLVSFLGVSEQVQANMTSADKQYVSDLLQAMQPISLRQRGLVQDSTHAAYELSDLSLESINMPTLVFHAKDDGLVPFSHGQYTAQHISGAKFVPLDSGGHLLVGQLDRIQTETLSFLKENKILR